MRIVLGPDTQAYAGAYGKTASGELFVAGDIVAAIGDWTSDTEMSASSVGSIFTQVTLDIVRVDPTQAESPDGTTINITEGFLPDYAVPQVDLSSLEPGARITALIWVHPQTQTAYLLRTA